MHATSEACAAQRSKFDLAKTQVRRDAQQLGVDRRSHQTSPKPTELMSNPAPDRPRQIERRSFGAWLAAMPRWKKGLVGGALACAVLGGIWMLVGGGGGAQGPAPSGPTGSGITGAGGSSFLPTGTRPPAGVGQPTAATEEPAAKGVFRLGSSFLVGFCIGSFVRAAVKMASIAVGFFLVALFLLDQAGFVVVDWNAIDQAWRGFWANVGEEWGNFQRFFTGRLPAAGLATLGLYAGLKRH